MEAEKSVLVIPARKRHGNTASKEKVKKLRVAAYCRVSTDTDEQATSYDAQVDHYTEYIQKNPTWQLAGIYADDGISGTGTRKREEFLRMIDDCMAGSIDMVVTKSISRFARNTIDCLKYIRQLKEKNIPVIFEKENINTLDAKGEVLITIMASLAQQESESLSKNVKLGLQFRYQQGKVQINHNWFLGYTKDKEGNLVVDPAQAEVVKRIYREYLEGRSCKKIAEGLEVDGIPNGAGSTKWWDSNILQILKNEKYMGDALLQKTFTEDVLTKKRVENDGSVPQYYVENSHEPIISKEHYHEVQAEIARRSYMKDVKNRRSGYCSKYALTGVLVCGDCGATFRRVVWNIQGRKEPVWRCRSRVTRDGDPCFAPTIHETDLHEAIIKAVQENFGSQNVVMNQLQQNITDVLGDGTDTELENCDMRLRKLQEELVKRVNAGKSYDGLAEEIRTLKDKRDKVLDNQAVQNEREKQIREMKEFLIEHSGEELEYDDSLVRKLIRKIVVNRHSLTIEFKSGDEVEINI
jgi:DNA invertase Pin-like site-specific DNA recombinase